LNAGTVEEEVEQANIFVMLVTSDVSQLLISILNALAFWNIDAIFVTLPVFQLAMFALKAVQLLNIPDILVTLEVLLSPLALFHKATPLLLNVKELLNIFDMSVTF
jgi:hypothetical protein